jgi:hypothetical protein
LGIIRGFVRVKGEKEQMEGDKEERQMGFTSKNNAKKEAFFCVFGANAGKKGVFGEGF